MHRLASRMPLVLLAVLAFEVPRSLADDDAAIFEKPVRLEADGKIIDSGDVWGHSGPCLADVDGDGLRDLVVGDFSGKFRVYRNLGTNRQPKYGPAKDLMAGGKPAQVPIYCCIGSSPHFVDFDSDGILDMISGSYDPGECYLFRGLGQGKYATRETIVDKAGKPLLQYPKQKQTWESFGSWPVMVDWDADGRLDLLVGGFDGSIHVYLNEGTSQKSQFAGTSVKVQAAGKDLEVPGQHAAIAIADWDGDGRWDILSGSENGGVYWYRDVGTKASPQFAAAQVLVKPHVGIGYDEFVDRDQNPVPGIRSQIAAVDYDGDGRIDLLLGDFCTTLEPKAGLAPEDKATLLAAVNEAKEVIGELRGQIQSLRDDFKRRYPGEKLFTNEIDAEFQKAYRALSESKKRKSLQLQHRRLNEKIKPFLDRPPYAAELENRGLGTSHGYVWLFRRKSSGTVIDSRVSESDPHSAGSTEGQTAPPRPTAREPVVVDASATPKRAARGDLVTLTVRVGIGAGWHIQTVQPHGLSTPTQLDLKLPPGFTPVGDWQTPQATERDSPTGPIYEGDIEFRRKLKITADAPEGSRELRCKFNYQACEEQRCLRPTQLELSAKLEVVSPTVAGLPAEKSESRRETAHHPGDGNVVQSPNGGTRKKTALTAAQIKDALVRAAAKLVHLKLVVVERGDFVDRSANRPVRVVFKEVWMHRRTAQVRMVWHQNSQANRWWTGFESINRPLTSADLASVPGVKDCVDMSRELVFADSRPLRPGPDGKPRTLHSVSTFPQFPSSLFVPLVEFDKPWIPAHWRSGLTVVDQIAREPLSHWHLVGEETMDGQDAILTEIAQQDAVTVPLKRHAGRLSLTQGYLVWFSKKQGLMPLRIEQTMRYGFDGREYRLERRPDGKDSLVYVASDFVPFRDLWVPRVGSQTVYRDKAPPPQKFDPDALVDKLLAEGTLRFPGELEIGYQREWRILSIEPIEPSLNLWFEPQPGAEVLNMQTHKRYIEGDVVASARFAARETAIAALVGRAAPGFPKRATWLNGEALTWQALRGKVVILDFWSIDCGPCHNDLPRLRQLYEDRGKNGLAVIGVHLAGSDLNAVKKEVGALHLEYPICIDTPLGQQTGKPDDQPFPSEFTAQFAINALPHFVVVDRHGVVAASEANRFQVALTIAQALAKAQK